MQRIQKDGRAILEKRFILVLDSVDRFFKDRANALVPVIDELIMKVAGLKVLITAEGSIWSNSAGRLESSGVMPVELKTLSRQATARMLATIAPTGFR